MRKWALVVVGLVGLAFGIAFIVRNNPPTLTAERPEALLAPPEQPAAETPSPSPEPSASPPKPAAADLPTVEIAQRPVHIVPENEPPTVPKVTLFDRSGKELPGRPVVLTPPRPATPPPVAPFSGTAQAAGGTALAVAGRSVKLFGVRSGDPRDRCGLGFGDGRSCADVARDALAQRLKRYPQVSCHTPAGQRGDPAAVCIDNSGTDLGGFLVAEGLALADLSQSYEYFGSEGVARSFRRGLWRNR
jgi:endonuclease YncB( thermonuclease family)